MRNSSSVLTGDDSRQTHPLDIAVLGGALALKLGLHLWAIAITPYEFHRDEFLYLAMGSHLHLWGMDFPPAIAILARAMDATIGVGLGAVRLVPALFSTVLVALTILLVRELGGRRPAMLFAALGVIACPVFLRSGVLFQPVVLDQLAWTLVLLALLRLLGSRDLRWWLGVGVALGAGLLVKFSIAFIGLGLLAGLLLLPERRMLVTRWPWIAFLIAVSLGSPSLVGQLRNGWPVIAYSRELAQSQLVHVSPLDFVTGQVAMLGPLVLLVVAGFWELVRTPRRRLVGLTCVGAFTILLLLRGKDYYFAPAYPTLLAAGAVWMERVTHRLGARVPWQSVTVRAIYAALVVAFALVALPISLPILSPQKTAAYAARLGITSAVTTNTGRVEKLPQDFADMLGWRERVSAVARIYDSLPVAQRRSAVILADNYGEAGAIDHYGRALGLPSAVCGCGTYWFFGPGQLPGATLVTIGVDSAALARHFSAVRRAGHLTDSLAVPEEQDLALYVASGTTETLQSLWPRMDPRR